MNTGPSVWCALHHPFRNYSSGFASIERPALAVAIHLNLMVCRTNTKKQKSLPSNWDLNQILFRNAFLVGTRTIQRQFQRTTRINGWVSFFPFSFFTDKATRRIICREHLLPKETRERGGRRSGAASIYITVVNYTGSFFSSFYLLEREIERAMLSRRVDVTCVRNHVKVVRFFSRLVGLRSPRARQA